MTVQYHDLQGQARPDDVCQRSGIERAEPICLRVPGAGIDQAIGALLIEAVNPVALEVTLAVQRELQARLVEADRMRHAQVERAQYECELAQHRYMRVDPDNRLVADSLEAMWNEKLRELGREREQYAQRKEQDQRATLNLPLPLCGWQQRLTPPAVIAQIDQLLDDHTVAEIANILNAHGMASGLGQSFHPQLVARLVRTYKLTTRYDRLRQRGMLTQGEVASALHITPHTVKIWLRRGLLRGHAYNDKSESLFEPLDASAPRRAQGVSLARRRTELKDTPDRANEVQYAT